MLNALKPMWYGPVGHQSVAKQRTKLPSNETQPVQAAPHRAGPREHELEKTENERRLNRGVVDEAET